ncbi:hypothetical protein DFH09DRAFT_1315892 [Mycena vulgaris]|nr:hypothetical protein DFH09DRAFT_1315892 [Mycena vulgaris]
MAAERAQSHIHLGFVYAIFYLWVETFPLVFNDIPLRGRVNAGPKDIYHFNQGVSGLPFLAFIVSGSLTYMAYCLYQKYHIAPRYAR